MKYGCQYFIYLILGQCTLLSYFALMGSVAYWKVIYDSQFVTIISVLFTFSFLCSTTVMLKYNTKFNPVKIIPYALSGCFVSLIIIILLYYVPNHTVKYYVTLIPVISSGFSSGIYFACIGACAAKISPQMFQATQMGLGIAALFIQIIKDIIYAFFQTPPTSPDYIESQFLTIVVYFGIAVAYIITCIILWEISKKQLYNQSKNEKIRENILFLDNETYTTVGQRANDKDEVLTKTKTQIFKIIAPTAFAQFAQYFGTYFCYPCLVTTIYLNELAGKISVGWWNQIIITLFFVADVIGRTLPKFKCVYNKVSKNAAIIMGYVRIVFIPLYLLMTMPKGKPVINSDIATIIVALGFGVSNGFVSTFLFMKYQEDLSKIERVTGSFFVTLFYQIAQVIGCLCGVGLAYVVK